MKKRKSFNRASTGLLGALSIASGTAAYGTPTPVAVPGDLTNTAGNTLATMVNWDVNSDGIIDFNFTNRFPNTASGTGVIWQGNMNSNAPTTNGVVSYAGTFVRYAFALPAGALINATNQSSGMAPPITQIVLGSRYRSGALSLYYGGFAADGRTAGTTANGAVTPGTFRFAGFVFSAADGLHFGWIQLATTAGLIDFVNAAYETTPLAAINAGAVPEPGTLALLAVGAAGVLGAAAKRRRA
jgi:PEP-CTERM motif